MCYRSDTNNQNGFFFIVFQAVHLSGKARQQTMQTKHAGPSHVSSKRCHLSVTFYGSCSHNFSFSNRHFDHVVYLSNTRLQANVLAPVSIKSDLYLFYARDFIRSMYGFKGKATTDPSCELLLNYFQTLPVPTGLNKSYCEKVNSEVPSHSW